MALTWENRHQNYSVVSVCEALRGDCQDNLIMTSPGGWLELEEAPVFTKDGRRFAMALSANGYKQVFKLLLHSISSNEMLSLGERCEQRHQPEGAYHLWQHGGDEHLPLGRGAQLHRACRQSCSRPFNPQVAHEIYFKATKENSPGERHLYKVPFIKV